MTPYPTEFPAAAFTTVISKLRGGDVSLGELAHAAWNVQGYAQAQVLGHPRVVGQTIPAGLADHEVLEAAVDNATNKENPVVQGIFPWGMVLSIVLKLLLREVP